MMLGHTSIFLHAVGRRPLSRGFLCRAVRSSKLSVVRASFSNVPLSSTRSAFNSSSKQLKKAVSWGTVFFAIAWYNFTTREIIEQEAIAAVEPRYASLFPESTWQPDTKVDPFMRRINVDGRELWLLGLGVRSVSFLKIHVYAG